MGTTLLDRLNVPVALLAFGVRRLPIIFPPVCQYLSSEAVFFKKKTGTGNNSVSARLFQGFKT
jgi:hypothetical protein